jgi:hypothetical protein
MSAFVHDDILDGALNVIKNGATQISVCSGTPTTYTEAVITNTLVIKSGLTSIDFTGPVDDLDGRKLTVNLQSLLAVINTGTAQSVCLCDSTSKLLYVVTCMDLYLSGGNTVTIPAWDIIITN